MSLLSASDQDRVHAQVNLETVYQDIWNALNQTDPRPLADHLLQHHASFEAVYRYFNSHGPAKNLNLQSLSKEDEHYLATLGIQTNWVRRNLIHAVDEPHFVDPLEFQIQAVKHGRLRAACPFTGAPIESRHSLLANIHVMFYRFVSREVFYVVTANIGTGYRRHALYFPIHDLLIGSGDPWGCEPDDLNELKARVVCHPEESYEYVVDQNRHRQTAVCLGFYHFAHHLWNELSSLERLYQKRLLAKVGAFLVLREPLGLIDEIYPELHSDRISRLATSDEMFVSILRHKYFAIRMGGYYIRQQVADRVYKVARSNCSTATLESVQKARSAHWPLLWVGIRVDSRTWNDPVEGLACMLVSLHERYPGLGVVFDGFSVPADNSTESPESRSSKDEYSAVVEQERAVVRAILKKIAQLSPRIPASFEVIGSSIYQANVWADVIDVYVSPYGSLQHKVGWLRSKPGVVHSNLTLLKQPPPRHMWAAAENGIKPRYVRPEAVRDIREKDKRPVVYRQMTDTKELGAGIRAAVSRLEGDPEYDNYEVDWAVLYEDLQEVLRCQGSLSQRFPTYCNRLIKTVERSVRNVVALLRPSKI
jgi:hypothetical protein